MIDVIWVRFRFLGSFCVSVVAEHEQWGRAREWKIEKMKKWKKINRSKSKAANVIFGENSIFYLRNWNRLHSVLMAHQVSHAPPRRFENSKLKMFGFHLCTRLFIPSLPSWIWGFFYARKANEAHITMYNIVTNGAVATIDWDAVRLCCVLHQWMYRSGSSLFAQSSCAQRRWTIEWAWISGNNMNIYFHWFLLIPNGKPEAVNNSQALCKHKVKAKLIYSTSSSRYIASLYTYRRCVCVIATPSMRFQHCIFERFTRRQFQMR